MDPPTSIDGATDEEVAAWLSKEEGRAVSVVEVRRIVIRALRKLQASLAHRGVRCVADLAPGIGRPGRGD